jgi:Ca2+-binding EF-hand superfamily protein
MNLRSSMAGGLNKVLSSVGLAHGQFTLEQENVLLRCFSMFDVDDDGKLGPDDIKQVRANACYVCSDMFCYEQWGADEC